MQPTDDAMKRDLQDSWARSTMAVVPGCPPPTANATATPLRATSTNLASGAAGGFGWHELRRSRAADVSISSLFPSEPGRALGLDPLSAASSQPPRLITNLHTSRSRRIRDAAGATDWVPSAASVRVCPAHDGWLPGGQPW
jgi:hypothetical protein